MRRERRQDVLDGAFAVDVAGDAKGREVANLFRGRDRAAEDKNRQLAAVELANRPHEVHSSGMRQAKIEDNQIDAREIGAHAGEQLHGALDGERGVTGAEQRLYETVAHEGGVVGNDDGLVGRHSGSRHAWRYRSRDFGR